MKPMPFAFRSNHRRSALIMAVGLAVACLSSAATPQVAPVQQPPVVPAAPGPPAVSPSPPSDSPAWFLDQGQQALNKHDYQAAVVIYERALKEARPLDDATRGRLYQYLALASSFQSNREKQIEYDMKALPLLQKERMNAEQVDCLLSLGLAHDSLHRSAVALGYFQQAFAIQRSLPSDAKREAFILYAEAQAYQDLRQRDDSISAYKQAAQKYEAAGLRADVAECWKEIAGLYSQSGRVQPAQEACDRCEQILQSLPDDTKTASVWSGLGSLYSEQGFYNRADKLTQRALATLEKQPEDLQTFGALMRAANLYTRQGDYEKAVSITKDHLAALQVLTNVSGFENRCAILWSVLGGVYDLMQDFDGVLDAYRRSEVFYIASGLPMEALSARASMGQAYADKNEFDQAMKYLAGVSDALHKMPRATQTGGLEPQIYQYMSGIYGRLGQYQKQLDCDKRIYALQKEDKALTLQVLAALQLADTYSKMHAYPLAIKRCEEASAHLKSLPDRGIAASVLFTKGDIYLSWGQAQGNDRTHLEQGEACLREALANAQGGNLHTVVGCKMHLGTAAILLEKYAEAIAIFRETLKQSTDMQDSRNIYSSLLMLNAAYRQSGDCEQALKYADLALKNAQERHNPPDIARIYREVAKARQKQGRLDLAHAALETALQMREELSGQVGEASQVNASEQNSPGSVYAWQAQIEIKRKQESDALVTAERGRTRGLARQTAQSRVGMKQFLSPAEATDLAAAAAERGRARNALQTAQDAALPPSVEAQKERQTRIQMAQARCEEAELRLRTLRDGLIAGHPEFRHLPIQSPPTYAVLQDIAQRNPNTLYLEYALVDDKTTLLFAFSRQSGLQVVSLPLGASELAARIEAWRGGILNSAADEPAKARSLYHALLGDAQIGALLHASWCKRLVVVPDGPLLNAPFAALMEERGKRLIARFPVSTTFSLGLLAWPQQKADAVNQLLCIADPLGPALSGSGANAPGRLAASRSGRTAATGGAQTRESLTRGRFAPLPAARVEASNVGRQQGRMHLLIGPQAREGEVKRLLPRYALLHFATHGSFEAHDGMRSFLVLAPEPGDSVEDGYLEAREIVELPLAARMAVLSACATAQGEPAGGEGMLGLVWAFRAAGCPSVVASQWAVEDASTNQLMTAFYGHLRTGARKDEALRRAMLETLAKHPAARDWAAFSLYGDTTALPPALFARP